MEGVVGHKSYLVVAVVQSLLPAAAVAAGFPDPPMALFLFSSSYSYLHLLLDSDSISQHLESVAERISFD